LQRFSARVSKRRGSLKDKKNYNEGIVFSTIRTPRYILTKMKKDQNFQMNQIFIL